MAQEPVLMFINFNKEAFDEQENDVEGRSMDHHDIY